jgi:hypothetical protein
MHEWAVQERGRHDGAFFGRVPKGGTTVAIGYALIHDSYETTRSQRRRRDGKPFARSETWRQETRSVHRPLGQALDRIGAGPRAETSGGLNAPPTFASSRPGRGPEAAPGARSGSASATESRRLTSPSRRLQRTGSADQQDRANHPGGRNTRERTKQSGRSRRPPCNNPGF